MILQYAYFQEISTRPHPQPTKCYRSRRASLSDSNRQRTSPTLTGPLTFLMIVRLSSKNSTRTYTYDYTYQHNHQLTGTRAVSRFSKTPSLLTKPSGNSSSLTLELSYTK